MPNADGQLHRPAAVLIQTPGLRAIQYALLSRDGFSETWVAGAQHEEVLLVGPDGLVQSPTPSLRTKRAGLPLRSPVSTRPARRRRSAALAATTGAVALGAPKSTLTVRLQSLRARQVHILQPTPADPAEDTI